ncbi:hypothetical protein CBR_g24322 [Chara braunii]|uniref:Solute carrier family 40 member n=1 Tax=Chara braunii TaxID=69332 RepID=A0A388JMK0_CHABU|nr:hypothetical protein CBR_g24322 [Chara braunii]|eukprot:GBG58973.1 hypothetical protein CBR_g24322 [Chara braunii]
MLAKTCCVTYPLDIWLVFRTDKLSSQVLGRARATVTPKGFSENNHIRTEPAGSKAGAFFSIEKGWRLFLSQPVFPASLAYVMLYFNVVLGPGSLMTAFLTQRGMEASSIGLFRAACAVTGFLATFTSVPLIARLGVLKTGAVSLLMQAGSLGLAVFAYMATPFGHKGSLNLFLICVVASRLGYWMYDVVDTQIFQTATPESQAGIIGATELALCSFAELVMLSLAIVAEDVSNFGSLAVLSTIAVAGSAAVYCNWIAKPTSDQVQLFPEEFEGVNGVSSRERKTSPREELEGDELDVERWRDRWETWDGRDIGGSNNWGECVGHHSSVLMSAAPL